MTFRTTSTERAKAIRDLAVHAVMTRGALEKSGAARLAVLREDGLMIGYRTPFNPLPPLLANARYDAALKGETHRNDPYGIDIWLEDFGKVFSASWDHGSAFNMRLCRSGTWQHSLAAVAVAEMAGAGHQPTTIAQEEHSVPRKPNTGEGRASRRRAAPTPSEAVDSQRDRLRALEQENKTLRRAISGLMIDKMILAKAAAGKL